ALAPHERERADGEEPAAKDDEGHALQPERSKARERQPGEQSVRRCDDYQMTLAPDRLRQRVARDECERDGKDCEEGEEQKCSSASVVIARCVLAVIVRCVLAVAARFASVVIGPSALAVIARSVFAVVRFV